MAGSNRVIIVGNLGKDVELRYSNSGTAIANFSVAATEKYKDQESTEWFSCVAFTKLAEICGEYLSKGSQVYIEGKQKTREWDDRDGNKRKTAEIIVDKMVMLGGGRKKSDSAPPKQAPKPRQDDDYGPPPDDPLIPF